MADVRTGLRGVAWLFYAILVLDFFHDQPGGALLLSVDGPALSFLDRSPATAWLTQFFLPHISVTASPVLNALGGLGGLLLLVGTLVFLAGAVPLYWAKLRRRGG